MVPVGWVLLGVCLLAGVVGWCACLDFGNLLGGGGCFGDLVVLWMCFAAFVLVDCIIRQCLLLGFCLYLFSFLLETRFLLGLIALWGFVLVF